MSTSDLAIATKALRRVYRSRDAFMSRRHTDRVAVAGLDLEVARGELFGLLGPNGAGKTTTIKMLSTLLLPTSGSAQVLNLDVETDVRALRRRIGLVLGGDRGLYERVSARDNLRYFAHLYYLPHRTQRRRVEEVLEIVGLSDRGDDRVERFSRGMRQRLHFARGLLHDPDLIFLDEPTIGVDPVGARELRTLTRGLVSAGKTVLLTTHYMPEAEELCDRMMVIAKGRVQALGSPAALKASACHGHHVQLSLRPGREYVTQVLQSLPWVCNLREERDDQGLRVLIQSKQDHASAAAMITAKVALLPGEVVAPYQATLEDVYIDLVREAANE